jgi:hypothetical protein
MGLFSKVHSGHEQTDAQGKFTTPVVSRYIKKAFAPPVYLNPSYTSFDESQAQRDYKITTQLNEMNFRGMTVNAIIDNHLVTQNVEHKKQAYFEQLHMEWNNQFMHTPTDKERLNNPAQSSFVNQRQMTVPNVYQQFYAFMKALSAAFGTLQS